MHASFLRSGTFAIAGFNEARILWIWKERGLVFEFVRLFLWCLRWREGTHCEEGGENIKKGNLRFYVRFVRLFLEEPRSRDHDSPLDAG